MATKAPMVGASEPRTTNSDHRNQVNYPDRGVTKSRIRVISNKIASLAISLATERQSYYPG